jgi:hypothetical protein
MASHSLPIPVPQARARTETNTTSRLPSVRVAIAVLAALLILFGWLHLLLAMQIASTDREILTKKGDLSIQKRDNAAVLRLIATAEAPEIMWDRSQVEGLVEGERVYLHIPLPTGNDVTSSERQEVLLADSKPQVLVTVQPRSLMGSALGELYGTQARQGP